MKAGKTQREEAADDDDDDSDDAAFPSGVNDCVTPLLLIIITLQPM